MNARVLRARVAKWIDPAVAYRELTRNSPYGIWLDAGPEAEAGRSYIAVPRGEILSASVERGTVTAVDTASGQRTVDEATIFETLRDRLETTQAIDSSTIEADGFALGWVGWFGYELAAQTAGVPTVPAPTDDAVFAFVDWALEFNHETRTVDILVLGDRDDLEERQSVIGEIMSRAPLSEDSVGIKGVRTASWRHNGEDYRQMVRHCLDAITAGDAYQLCLTNEVRVETEEAPLEVYLRLRRDNPSHHGALLRMGEVSLLSSSPEVFLSISNSGLIRTKPIKGTRARSVHGSEDAALAEELITSEKERAENLMIVDLMRNDVGRIAELGSVQVDSLLEVESYPHVHQLVSTVSGQLARGMSPVDAIEACFPAGSMTGAPKISAMKILAGLEHGPRGIYSGAFGYIGLDGGVNLAMVIRSIVMSNGLATMGTGGGITSGSEPEAELEETRLKVAPLLRALGASVNDYS